ncbi:MAG: efflux RND transporter permease subunit [Acidimicrobiales bacterium]
MSLTRTVIRRPIATAMVFAIIGIMGAVAATKLPINELPNVTFPAVSISVADPGANSTTVEQQATRPLEQALQSVSGVTKMVSTSSQGNAQINLSFVGGTNPSAAANSVAQVVARAQKQLPAGISPPSISEVNPLSTPLMTVNFSGLAASQLYTEVSSLVQPRLDQVSGVGQITLAGGLEPETNVVVDPAVLAARGLTLKDVTSAIASQNLNAANGATSSGSTSNSVSTNNQAGSTGALDNLVVGNPGGLPVTLGEVANVEQGFAPQATTNELNGQPTVALTVLPQTGANAVATDSALKAALSTQIQKLLPAGMRYTITGDSTSFTLAALTATAGDLALAVILASLVILLFLQSARQTLIVAVAIPTALLATGLMMFFFHFSLDLISLLALSLLIGILVDDAIVVIENITRHLHMGKGPATAAHDGRMEIGAAAVALTLTDVIVFLPVAFVTGNTGAIFREFGITIVVATLFSLLISFTLTPMLAAHWLKSGRSEPRRRVWRVSSKGLERGIVGLQNGYERVLRRSLRHGLIVVGIAVAALAVTVAFVPSGLLGTAYIPQADSGLLDVNAQMPPGTTLAATNAAIATLSSRILGLPGVTDVVASAGQSGGGKAGNITTNTGTLTVDLLPATQRPESIYTVETDVAQMAHQIPGLKAGTSIPTPLVSPGSSAIAVILRGPDLTTLNQLSTRVVSAMKGLPGLGQVQSTATQATPAWNIVVNQAQAQSFGLNAQTVAAEVSTAVAGSAVTTMQTTSGIAEPIEVTIPGNTTLGLTQLESLPVANSSNSGGSSAASSASSSSSANSSASGSSSSGSSPALPGANLPAPVTLAQVATITHGTAPLAINEYDQLPQVTVHSGLQKGYALGTAVPNIKTALHKVSLPAGYNYQFGGQVKQQASAFGPLLVALYLAPVLIYMLLAGLYESLLLPFTVLLAVPLALFGAFGALALDHQTLNLFSLLGIVMLVGLVSKNAILLVDYTETLRKRGVERHQAIIEAARTRLRPILMTTLTLVIAMLPIAFLTAPGSEYRSPVGLVLIGGLSTSTLLTLIVVPTLYTYLDNMRQRWFRFRGKAVAPAAVVIEEHTAELPTVGVS